MRYLAGRHASVFKIPGLLLACVFFSLAALAESVTTPFNGLTLSANLEKSSDWPEGSTVLITHGTLSHNRSEFISTLQSLFHESDVSSLAINLSLSQNNRTGVHDCDTPQRHKYDDGAAEIAAWVSWLKANGVLTIVPLGHSRGGNQTTRLAVEYPDPAISGMILIAPAVANGNDTNKNLYASSLAQARELVAAGTPEALLQNTDFLYCRKTSVAAATFLSYYDSNPEHATGALLKKLELPVLVFAGTEDTVVPVEQLKKALAPLPGHIRLVVIDGAGHFFRDLNADELVELSIEFLNTIK